MIQPNDLQQKIESLLKITSSTKNAIEQIEVDLQYVNNNVSTILNTTKYAIPFISHLIIVNLCFSSEIQIAQRGVPTKQFLNNAILGLKSQPIHVTVSPPHPTSEDDTKLPTTCDAATKNGIFKLQLNSEETFFAPCHIINGTPWMVIQSREDGSVNFYRNWIDYVNGFGNLNGEFWLGLDHLHEITSTRIQKLLIVLEDFDGHEKRAEYTEFAISGEKEQFGINILGTYNGTAGDSLAYHAGHKFSTFDLDNDSWKEGNCAQTHQGGWWYNACDMR